MEKNITYFFTKLGVPCLSSGNVTRLIEAGFDSVPIIVSMKKDEFLDVEGFQEKMASKIYKNIRTKLKEASLSDIITASNIFGRGIGVKKAQLILDHFPDILTSEESYEEKFDKLINVDGFAEKTAEYFLDHVDTFLEFIYEIKQQYKLKKQTTNPVEKDTSHGLYNKTIVMTGFRNKNLEKQLKLIGTNMSGSVSKNTFALLVKNKEDTTSKIVKAQQLNIPCLTENEFIERYLQ